MLNIFQRPVASHTLASLRGGKHKTNYSYENNCRRSNLSQTGLVGLVSFYLSSLPRCARKDAFWGWFAPPQRPFIATLIAPSLRGGRRKTNNSYENNCRRSNLSQTGLVGLVSFYLSSLPRCARKDAFGGCFAPPQHPVIATLIAPSLRGGRRKTNNGYEYNCRRSNLPHNAKTQTHASLRA